MYKTIRQKIIELNKTLKSWGYIKSSKIEDYYKVYFNTYENLNSDAVVLYIYNCHNDYTPKSIAMFQDIAIRLIRSGYEIRLKYPCYINVYDKR